MSDIFREVEEDVQRDRLLAFWNNYRYWIIGAAISALIGTAASVGWRNYEASKADQTGVAYQNAIAMAKVDAKGAEQAWAALVEGGGAVGQLSEFHLAATALANNDKKHALEILSRIAQSKIDGAARDLAALEAAYIAIDTGVFDQAEVLLAPLRKDESAYRALALEASLMMAIIKQDQEKAKEWAEALKSMAASPDMPGGLRERVQLLRPDIGL